MIPFPAGSSATVTYVRVSNLNGTAQLRLRLAHDHLLECHVSLFTTSLVVDGSRVSARWSNKIRFQLQDAETNRDCVLVTRQGKDGWPLVVPRVLELVVSGYSVPLTHEPLRDESKSGRR